MDMFAPSDFDPYDDAGWATWNLVHIISHQQIGEAITLAGKTADSYPLDFDDKSDNWKEVHQLEHSSIYNALSLTGMVDNLSDVDFNDVSQFRNWMYYHALAHQQINETLGL